MSFLKNYQAFILFNEKLDAVAGQLDICIKSDFLSSITAPQQLFFNPLLTDRKSKSEAQVSLELIVLLN